MLTKLTQIQKTGLLVATIIPVVYIIYFFIHVCSMIFAGPSMGPPSMGAFHILFVIHAFMTLWMIGLLVVFVLLIVNNKDLNEQERILWIVLLVVGHLIAMFAYWYLKVHQKGNQLKTPHQGQPSP